MTRTATDTWFRRGPEFLSEKDSAFNISIDSSIVKKVPATMEAENNDDIEIDDEPRGAKIKAFIKLATIVICYATAFVSLVQLGFWLVHDPEFGPVILHTPVMTWFETKWTHGVWWDSVTYGMICNFGLLLTFCVQHSLLSKRNLESTAIWMRLHYSYQIDRPLYILGTGLVLQVIIRGWTTVPVVIWSDVPWVKDYYHYAHILAWVSLYGTSLMLDLPDMVGFNQVVISSPTVTQKSPDLQIMHNTQRHMGLLPFTIILLIHPTMTLDRFLLTICTGLYTYLAWRSNGSYEYASRMKQMKKHRL